MSLRGFVVTINAPGYRDIAGLVVDEITEAPPVAEGAEPAEPRPVQVLVGYSGGVQAWAPVEGLTLHEGWAGEFAEDGTLLLTGPSQATEAAAASKAPAPRRRGIRRQGE